MKLRRNFLVILLSLGVLIIFNTAASAMEGKNEENLISVENIDIEKRDVVNRIYIYGKIKYICDVFKLFNIKLKEMVLEEVCFKTLKDPIKIVKQILRAIHKDIYSLRPYDFEFEKKVIEIFKSEKEFSYEYLKKSKKDIENYLIGEIYDLEKAIKEVKKQYEDYIEGEKFIGISGNQFISILSDMNCELKRFESLLKAVKEF